MMRSRFRKGTWPWEAERGNVLVGTLVATVLVGGLVLSSTMLARSEVKDSKSALERTKALTIAEAGVEQAIHHFRSAIKKTAFKDPFLGVKALFDDGMGGYKSYLPFDAQSLMDGGNKVGEFTVSATAADRDGGMDITISSTGFFPAAPKNLVGQESRISQVTVQAVIRLDTQPSKVFDYSYFVNNWGWFYGNTIFCNGNAASNGQFDVAGYSPTVTGQPTYDGIAWTGSNADLQGYRDDNGDGLQDGKDGGVFSGWDIVGVQSLQGEGGKTKNQHDFQKKIEMPNLSDLTQYEKKAKDNGGSITIGGTVVSNAVYGDEGGEKQNLYLHGTNAKPIEINGTVVVRGDVLITGVVKGKGAIYSGGNVFVPNNLSYKDPPTTSRPTNGTEAATESWISANKDKDFLGLFAKENVVLGDYTDSSWQSYVSNWLGNSMNSSKEDAGEDQIPNTRDGRDGTPGTTDDDVLEGDGLWTTEKYTAADQALGLIPAGKSVGDPIPGTGEDIDGDGVYDSTLTVADMKVKDPLTTSNWGGNIPAAGIANYSNIASLNMTNLDGVFYTNHAFAWVTLPGSPINVNGAIISRNESIIYGGSIHMNYDSRMLGGKKGVAGDLLPVTPKSIQILSWQILEL
jgi:hypothetical protein